MWAKRDYAMLALLFGCGFRRSELVGLELDDIEMRHERVSSLSSIGVRKSKMFASTRLWQNCRLVLPANANLSSLQAGQKLKLNRTPLVPPKRNGKRCN